MEKEASRKARQKKKKRSPHRWAPPFRFQLPSNQQQAAEAVRSRHGVVRGAAGAGGGAVGGGGVPGGVPGAPCGWAGHELGHPSASPAPRRHHRAPAPRQRLRQGEALRGRPAGAARAGALWHPGDGRPPQRVAHQRRRQRQRRRAVGAPERLHVRLQVRRRHQGCGGGQRAVPQVVQGPVRAGDAAGGAERPGGAREGRARQAGPRHRPAERRRLRVRRRQALLRRLPVRHPGPDGEPRPLPTRQQRHPRHQHLPVPLHGRRPQLPERLRLLPVPRRAAVPGQRPGRQRALHQRVRRQLRHADRGAGEARAGRHPRCSGRDRVAHRRRPERQRGQRAEVQPGPLRPHRRRQGHPAPPADARRLRLRAARRGRQERRPGQLRAPLGRLQLRRLAQVQPPPRRRPARRAGQGRPVPVQAVVRAPPRRQPHRPRRRQRRAVRVPVRRLHQPQPRLLLRQPRRPRQHLLRVQPVLPGGQPDEERLRLQQPLRHHHHRPVPGGLPLPHSDRHREARAHRQVGRRQGDRRVDRRHGYGLPRPRHDSLVIEAHHLRDDTYGYNPGRANSFIFPILLTEGLADPLRVLRS